MQDTIFRAIKDEDFEQITEIIGRIWNIGVDYEREQMFGKVNGKSWDEWKVPEQIKFLKTHRDTAVVQVDDSDKVIGFASWIIHRSRNIGEVTANGIHPGYTGKGLGSRQLQYVLERLRESGVDLIEVSTGLNDGHIPARKMYEKAGFKPLFSTVHYGMRAEKEDKAK